MDNDSAPLAGGDSLSVHSGFPNPALDADYGPGPRLALDLNQLLVRHPASTYLFRITGHRWSEQGIYDGDIAVIDRARRPGRHDLIVAWQHDSFRLCRQLELAGGGDDTVWGVVTAVIHQYHS